MVSANKRVLIIKKKKRNKRAGQFVAAFVWPPS